MEEGAGLKPQDWEDYIVKTEDEIKERLLKEKQASFNEGVISAMKKDKDLYDSIYEKGIHKGKEQMKKKFWKMLETWYQKHSINYLGKKDMVCEIDRYDVDKLKQKVERL